MFKTIELHTQCAASHKPSGVVLGPTNSFCKWKCYIMTRPGGCSCFQMDRTDDLAKKINAGHAMNQGIGMCLKHGMRYRCS